MKAGCGYTEVKQCVPSAARFLICCFRAEPYVLKKNLVSRLMPYLAFEIECFETSPKKTIIGADQGRSS